jgi:hypothetical protein
MPALMELLADEAHSGVRAVLGHFFFAFIHPYMDGNGRLSRFITNGAERRKASRASSGRPGHHSNYTPFPAFIRRSSVDLCRNNRSQWKSACHSVRIEGKWHKTAA